MVGGFCVLVVALPGGDSGSPGVAAIPAPRQCFDRGRVVACFHEEYGSWSAANGCYLSPAPLQPVAGHPVWEARTDGVIYNCVHPSNPGFVTMVWGPASEMVQPRALAEQLRASMRFDPVSIGIEASEIPAASFPVRKDAGYAEEVHRRGEGSGGQDGARAAVGVSDVACHV